MLRIKARLKKVLPYVELLSVYHRIRNRNTLTVVVFHRVLAVDDARWPHAHPEWTVSDVVFDQCLQFFRRNYYVISLEELLSSVEQGKKLPNRSLLITFDDGYADNEEYALPLLERERVPAVLFLTSDFVNRKSRPWTEELVAAFRAGAISSQSIAQLYQALFNKPDVAPVGPTKQLNEIAERWTFRMLRWNSYAGNIWANRCHVPANLRTCYRPNNCAICMPPGLRSGHTVKHIPRCH
jgi:hypothetical protein